MNRIWQNNLQITVGEVRPRFSGVNFARQAKTAEKFLPSQFGVNLLLVGLFALRLRFAANSDAPGIHRNLELFGFKSGSSHRHHECIIGLGELTGRHFEELTLGAEPVVEIVLHRAAA